MKNLRKIVQLKNKKYGHLASFNQGNEKEKNSEEKKFSLCVHCMIRLNYIHFSYLSGCQRTSCVHIVKQQTDQPNTKITISD